MCSRNFRWDGRNAFGVEQNGDELPGARCHPAAHLFSLDSMVKAVAIRLDGGSMVSTWNALHLLKNLRLAVDEVVHHDDVMLFIVVRPRGDVAGLDPDRRDAGVIELDAEE